MRLHNWFLLAALGIGGYLLYKNRGKLVNAVAPDQSVQAPAQALYGTLAQDIPGTIATLIGTGGNQGSYDPNASALSDNSTLTDVGMGLESDYGGELA
jgi:hypothetical protein